MRSDWSRNGMSVNVVQPLVTLQWTINKGFHRTREQ